MDDALVGFADAIEALRAELTDAMQRGRGEAMRFVVELVELTVQAVITKDGTKVFGAVEDAQNALRLLVYLL